MHRKLHKTADFGRVAILIIMGSPPGYRPSKDMREAALVAGTCKHPLLNREDGRIQIVTVDEVLGGARLKLPMGRKDAIKSTEAIGDRHQQREL